MFQPAYNFFSADSKTNVCYEIAGTYVQIMCCPNTKRNRDRRKLR